MKSELRGGEVDDGQRIRLRYKKELKKKPRDTKTRKQLHHTTHNKQCHPKAPKTRKKAFSFLFVFLSLVKPNDKRSQLDFRGIFYPFSLKPPLTPYAFSLFLSFRMLKITCSISQVLLVIEKVM